METRFKGNNGVEYGVHRAVMTRLPSLDGGGMDAMIFSNWLRVELPGKSGWPSRISPKMQPRLHISTPFVYLNDFVGIRNGALRPTP